MAVKGFRDLFVWQRSMELVVAIYQVTEDFPSKERYGLTNQFAGPLSRCHRISQRDKGQHNERLPAFSL